MGFYSSSIFAFIFRFKKPLRLKIKNPLTNLFLYQLVKFHQNYSLSCTRVNSELLCELVRKSCQGFQLGTRVKAGSFSDLEVSQVFGEYCRI